MSDLFASAGLEVPTGGFHPGRKRRQARRLVEGVDRVTDMEWDTTLPQVDRWRRYAKSIGAHSVARALYWYTWGHLSHTDLARRVRRVARNYLARQEDT